jgi:serine/threonine protein kinase
VAFWKRLFASDTRLGRTDIYGDYKIVEQVARGRLSTLYRGTHVQTGEVAAIKVLSDYACRVAEKLTRKLKKEWEGERQLRLEHRHVVRTIACGKEHERYYIVMEYLPGGNVAELLRSSAKSLAGRRVEVMRQAGRGLGYVHGEGVIHRDICPRNVMISAYGAAKLIDFGVAAERGDRIRNTGQRTGRPVYMAPELIRTNRFNDQTDIYAFGVSLYEVTTGQRPFRLVDDPYKAMTSKLNMEPFSLRKVRPSISERLERVILRAMAPKPKHRFRTMAEVLDALEGIDDGDL